MPVKSQPDFERLRTALFGGQPDRIPLVELFVDPAVRKAFLGHPADEAMQLISSKRQAADPYAWHIQRQIRRFEAHWSNRD